MEKTLSWTISNYIWVVLNHMLPTKVYLNLRYHQVFKKWIDWSNPRSFTEKLQWMKVYGCRPEYVTMVDKLAVKQYVGGIIGEEIIIPTLKVWEFAEEMDFSALPDSFVLKANHDSGTVLVCKDKRKLNRQQVVKYFKKALSSDYYKIGRETPYKYVPRRIFAEKFLDCGEDREIKDYKFFCFNGEPKIFKINFDRFSNFTANYYDLDMNVLPFGEVDPAPDYSKTCEKPERFEYMVEICRKLSKGIPFVRVDLYNVNGKVYFGELTFFPTSGFGPFTSEEWDNRLGDWLVLPKNKQ